MEFRDSDLAAAFEAGGAIGAPVVEVNGSTFKLTPDGWEWQKVGFDDEAARPRRVVDAPSFGDEASFAAYCARYWDPDESVIFAQRSGHLEAIFDYHPRVDPDMFIGQAGWKSHRAKLEPVASEAWRAWSGWNGRGLTQEGFLELLDKRIGDIVAPDGADLNEVIRFFRVHTEIGFQSGRNLDNGAASLVWTEDHAASGGKTGELVVPTQFVVRLKVYRDSEPRDFTARLRWRVSKPNVGFTFEFNQEELDEYRDAVHAERNSLLVAAGITPIFLGKLSA